MWRYIIRFLIGVVVSFYFFPTEFTLLPGQNTKKLLAVIGLLIWGYNLIKKRNSSVGKDMIPITIYALLVSLIGVFSIIYNNTPDITYATYFMSMWVWLGGAYAVVSIIKAYHKTISVELVCNYLVGVCVIQCIIALSIDTFPLFKSYIDQFFVGGQYMDEAERMYGIGCSLDIAGSRFSAVLIMMTILLVMKSFKSSNTIIAIYMVSFMVIAIIGNMIARTTTVGLVISLIYLLIRSVMMNSSKSRNKILRWLLVSVIITVPIVVHYYNTDIQFKENLRFAFEGFFSLVEKGEWDVHSNNRLKTMVVFPDNAKTWIIGDGYFDGPTNTDPYYVGPPMTGFYMWTDVGYLRFIFYFGLIGLTAFMAFFVKCGQTCAKKFSDYSLLFWLLTLLNFIIWFKVSTDIFVVFALFLCISKEDNDEYENQHENSISDPLDI